MLLLIFKIFYSTAAIGFFLINAGNPRYLGTSILELIGTAIVSVLWLPLTLISVIGSKVVEVVQDYKFLKQTTHGKY